MQKNRKIRHVANRRLAHGGGTEYVGLPRRRRTFEGLGTGRINRQGCHHGGFVQCQYDHGHPTDVSGQMVAVGHERSKSQVKISS